MYDNVKDQMQRYPVFSYQQNDQSQVFKDESIQKTQRRIIYNNTEINNSKKKRTQTIVNIYDKINTNNANDPLYPKHSRNSQQYKNKHYSTISSARNSKITQRQSLFGQTRNQKNIQKFVGQIANTITNQDCQREDIHRLQKISLLKRIIEHYNLKSVQKKYYSNLIKSFGLKIQSINNSDDLAKKKDLYIRNMQSLKQVTQSSCQDPQTTKTDQNISQLQKRSKRKNQYRKFKPSLSFMNYKPLKQSTEIGKSEKSIKVQQDKKIQKKHNIDKMRKTMEPNQKIIQKPLKLHISVIQSKIMKYRQFLFILNFSNHLYRQLDFHKYENQFKYYTGRGNNANLIKSLMKKRFWFEETNKIQQAHFIWTQIKVNQIFENQQSCEVKINKKRLQNELTIIGSPKIQKQKHRQRSIELGITMRKQTKKEEQKVNKTIRYGKNQVSAKNFQPFEPILKILTFREMKDYKQIQDNIGMKKNVQFIRKVRVCKRKLKIQQQEIKIHNHFPLNGLLGNKKAMYYNLREYCRLTQNKLNEYVPLTFHIKKGFLDQQYKKLSQIYSERKKQKLPNHWIMKPGQFSNRGKGISCTNKLQQIRQRIIQTRKNAKKSQSSLIVQQYISNPLLYYSRKFDIRVFMMITCINGKIKGYWYQEGYIRTSSFTWNISQIGDKYIHLTNDAIQKTCYEYGMYQPGNKISYSQLQRYLSTLAPCGRNLDFFSVVYPKMRSIATDTIKSVYLNIDKKRLRDNFEIFGLDFMLDNSFKPWLIQVNTNPCLQINCPLLERIIPHMLQNALRISIDPLFPPPLNVQTDYKYAIPQNAIHYNKFQLVFDQNRDGNYLQRLYNDSKIMQQLDDIEQDQEQFQEEGEQIEYQV